MGFGSARTGPYTSVQQQNNAAGGTSKGDDAAVKMPNAETTSGVKICSNCGGRGHVGKVCPSPKECNCCGSIKHEKNTCTYVEKNCSLCGKKGHMMLKCMQKDQLLDQLTGIGKGGAGKGKGGSRNASKSETCTDFQKGTCKYGNTCKWKHE
eukprot:TRINITY_DN1685_c0_g1_i8.p1 TRINITY_DN1685_c0_g1~~TRINITY_DN1685_c0_g1_i8.p1  ORF type:complete len:152 (-),score=24.53 TRINITY_DN1685_c0_g1_i8:110-565(-)